MLTLAQQKTLDYLRQYWRKHGHSPSLTEIAAGIGITSKGVIHRYVQALIEAGYVVQTPGRKRGLRLVEIPETPGIGLPLLGRIAAGQPIEAIRGEETFDLSTFVVGSNRYALRVKGDSMIEAGILNGDTVVIEARDAARDGEMVVALIDESETTLKRLKRRKDGSIQLTPANASIAPMIYSAERVHIQGVVVGVFRSYR
ncbi:MAG: transcriptional repressor LexA [Gammaproteobacteria bacterium]|nr:transcriptional repressor LexA [Gammaproteobacteria bacterium]